MNEDNPLLVFVVEGKKRIPSSLSVVLKNAGFRFRVFHSWKAALQSAREQMPALIIVDVPLLHVGHPDLLRSVAAAAALESTRTIVLSDRVGEEDKVGALEAGADDYITKPYSERELAARVRAVLRSKRTLRPNRVLRVGGISADLDARRVWKDGQEQHLTATEFNLLVYFMHDPGRIIRRKELLSGVWPTGNDDSRVVDVYVHQLRKKIEGDPSNPTRLVTCWKGGYVLLDSNGYPLRKPLLCCNL
jgi:two-component system KDP operon response regulator KdpE